MRRRAELAVLVVAATTSCHAGPPGPELVAAPAEGEVAAILKGELARAVADDRILFVYVGASWCEPCDRFRRAVERGGLRERLPRFRFVAFDRDRDGARLAAAGCASKLLPLFARPDADGRCSTARLEGAQAGDAGTMELTAKLRALVGAGGGARVPP
ncbi:MAG: thioredoxin family protein [Myxococcales bacterium]|nr:thioredoxin family protein [Myxococcales bacterium]